MVAVKELVVRRLALEVGHTAVCNGHIRGSMARDRPMARLSR